MTCFEYQREERDRLPPEDDRSRPESRKDTSRRKRSPSYESAQAEKDRKRARRDQGKSMILDKILSEYASFNNHVYNLYS